MKLSPGALRAPSAALGRVRPLLALALLLVSGGHAFAASWGPECARPHDAGQHAVGTATAAGAATPTLSGGHEHPSDRYPPADALPGITCTTAATTDRTLGLPAPVEQSRLSADHVAAPISVRPGAPFRPPRTT